MKNDKELSRRTFLQTTALSATAAMAAPQLVWTQTAESSADARPVVAALGDTLIPSTAGDPGYRSLEGHGITEEALRRLSPESAAGLRLLEQSSKDLFAGLRFSELSPEQRSEYLQMIVDGNRFADPELLQKLRAAFRENRRTLLTLFYQNYPEHRVPRDAHDIPVLKPGDLHQITTPNTRDLVTGWDISPNAGPLSWEEEEQRRAQFQKIDWSESSDSQQTPLAEQAELKEQQQFTKYFLAANQKKPSASRYDVVIVGAGLAGSILAARLAEHGVNPANGERLKIALIEWGPYLKGNPHPGYGHPLRRLLFTNVRHEFRDGGRYSNPWGFAKLVGGSTAHFGAQAFRLLPEDLQHWRNETGVDWTEAELQQARQEVEAMFHVHALPDMLVTHGQRLFAQAAGKLGYTTARLAHARRNCIHCAVGCDDGQMCKYDSKMSALVTYVPLAEQHGVEIIPNTRVEKVIIEKRGSDFRATGVWAVQNGEKLRIDAAKVIVAASVNASPQLFYNSGYGPREMVSGELLVENANVGRHVDGKLSAPTFPALFPFPLKDGPRGMPAAYYFFQGGTADGYDRLIFKEGTADVSYPDDLALSEFAPEFGWGHKQFMKEGGDRIANSGTIQYYPRRGLEGRIERDGRHVFSVRDPQYARRMIEGMEIVQDVFREMGASRISNLDGRIRRLQEIAGASAGSLPTTHQSCSCRAGADRSNSVVNSQFESHDIRDLFVCDLSVPPRVTLGNPGICLVAHVSCLAWRRIVRNHFSRPA